MAIIDNIATKIGDILRVQTEVPIVGVLSLFQFVDTTTGESETDYFRKEFRYSVDGGLTFSEWEELTSLNIQSIQITKYDSFVLEYRYTRVGNTPEVNLSFEDILVSGEVEELPYPVYKKTIFNSFFNISNLNIFGWALNVLEKLYQKGLILPDYIERGRNQSNLEDEDFIVYWNSITHFFAVVVYYARQFEDFNSNQTLVEQFLKSRDLIPPDNDNLSDLLYLYNNHIKEYKKRGTIQIIDRVENGADIDGELIRLTGSKIFEEFIFAQFQNFESGWCLGKSSPTWRNTENIVNLIKGYEFQNKVLDLDLYPIIEPDYVSLVNDKINIIDVVNGVLSGVGGDTKKINVDPSQDYEISFRVSQSVKEQNLVFGCRVWDVSGNELIFKNAATDVDSNYFFYQEQMNLSSTEYWVRGILWNNQKPIQIGETLNIGIGNNLRLPSNAAKITPIIGVYGSGSTNTILIDSIKIRPLKLNFSRGQLGIHNLIYLLSKNNNSELTDEKVKEIIVRKLIPYNSFLKTNFYE